jgi:multidrug efflux pump subunit AcrA (membrane-fusion protein)
VSQKSKILKTILLGVVLPSMIIALGVTILVGMGVQQPKQVDIGGVDSISKMSKLPIVGVSAIRSYEGLETLDVNVNGSVVPYRLVTLAAEVAGRIKHKSEECQIGKYIHKGDVLFRLDATDFQLEVDRLAALRDSEYAQQKELDQELANGQKSLLLADEDYALQERELARLLSLPKGIASETELDQARRLKLNSANQRLAIQNQLRLLESRRTRIVLAEKLASAQLEQAKVNLERTEVKAPISGVIITEAVQEDSFVQKGASLCVIDDTQRVEVSCSLRADQLLLILDQTNATPGTVPSSRVMKSASYELPPTPVVVSYRVAGREDTVYEWHGHLSRYEGIGLDSQSRTVPIRVMVDAPQEVWQNGIKVDEEANGGLPALVRGMFVDCSIRTIPSRPLVLIPKLALKPGNQLWQFEPNADLVADESATVDAKNDTASSSVEPKKVEPKKEAAPKPKLKLEEWASGNVKILRDVKVISTIRLPEDRTQEYWIAEARPDLLPGSLAIVTPLANMIGDGTDRARYQIAALGEKAK